MAPQTEHEPAEWFEMNQIELQDLIRHLQQIDEFNPTLEGRQGAILHVIAEALVALVERLDTLIIHAGKDKP